MFNNLDWIIEATSSNTAYTLRAYALALQDIRLRSQRRICWNRYTKLALGRKIIFSKPGDTFGTTVNSAPIISFLLVLFLIF